MNDRTPSDPSTLEGRLERITYSNPENHYCIAILRLCRSQTPVTVVGFMAALRPGENLKMTGSWETHPRFGQQFKVSSYTALLPDTLEDIQKYLESGLIKGIGPAIARRLVKRFGTGTLEMIAQHPQKLCEVDGIGKTKAEQIAQAWKEHHATADLTQFLQAVGLGSTLSAKVIKAYGPEARKSFAPIPIVSAGILPASVFLRPMRWRKNWAWRKPNRSASRPVSAISWTSPQRRSYVHHQGSSL
jgi:exodeoxyribonuclease V alpha subunit